MMSQLMYSYMIKLDWWACLSPYMSFLSQNGTQNPTISQLYSRTTDTTILYTYGAVYVCSPSAKNAPVSVNHFSGLYIYAHKYACIVTHVCAYTNTCYTHYSREREDNESP